jgi:hypothetical protein
MTAFSPIRASGIAESQSLQELVFTFVPTGAVATNGSIVPICRAQAAGAARARLMVGLGDLSTAKLTAAQALALVNNDVPQAASVIPSVSPTSADFAQVATGVKGFLDGIEAAADGKYCVAFAVGGINLKDVVSARVVQFKEAGPVAGAVFAGSLSNPVKIYDQGSSILGANSLLVKDASLTEVALTTDKCVFSTAWGFVLGAFIVAESDNLVLAAGQALELRVIIKV